MKRVLSWFKRGQSVLEYAIIVAVVSAAFLAMALYVKNAIQSKLGKIDGQVAGKMKSGIQQSLPPLPPI